MVTFTSLQQFLSEYAPDSHSLISSLVVLVLVLDLYLSTIFEYLYLWESTCCQEKVIFCCNWHTLASVLWDSECLDYWFLCPSFTVWHYTV